MKIKEIEIENYRNFDKKIKMSFDYEINFIVGENNLGKSNFIKLLNKLFNSKSNEIFSETDFNDKDKEIKILLKLCLDKNEELGVFEDNFNSSGETHKEIDIEIKQMWDEDSEITSVESGRDLKVRDLRKFNLFYIDSANNNNNHLSFNGKGDVSSTLNLLLGHCSADDSNKLKEDLKKIEDFPELKKLLNSLNSHFCKLDVVLNNTLKIDFNNFDDILNRLFTITESGGIDFSKSGEGVKSLLYLEFAILYKLFKLNEKQDYKIKRFDSLIVIDEPEIHLHSYRQRAFVKRLINDLKFNGDTDENGFKTLLFDLFGIEEFDRQIFIVTHSPNILLDNYNQIIRFSMDAGKVIVISGKEIEILGKKQLKNYFNHIKTLKNCFFSRGAIIGEGATELGAFPAFFEILGEDPDNLGIEIISAEGDEAVPKIKELLEKFNVKVEAIVDRDNNIASRNEKFDANGILLTNLRDFEDDFVENLDAEYFFNNIDLEEIGHILNSDDFVKLKLMVEGRILSADNKEELKGIMRRFKHQILSYPFSKASRIVPERYKEIIDRIIHRVRDDE
ncbi:MAG: AAA family ATPase [Nanoarchaeota archaeon]|jgi:putative ATP-dependent endonuclease of OLD family|nr:AAA family ATPase [Nanoarchaeota archaeon]